jgi:peptidoglycan/LPS O-acetylase OafA/YrhL
MQNPSPETRVNFQSVQYLRGIAAIAVVYFHTKVYLPDFAWPVGRQFGYGGVDLFFAISGFIMMVTTTAKSETPLSFYVKRIIRVVPMYWGATLATLLLFLAVPSAFLKQSATADHVILSMLFIPHASPSESGAAPFFKIGWTLNFEMFFYLVFGLALLFATAWQRLVAITLFFVALVLFGIAVEPTNAALGYYTSPFVLEFLMGAIVGYLTMRGVIARIPDKQALVGACLALACVLLLGGGQGDGLLRTLIFGVPAALLVVFAVSTEQHGTLVSSSLLRRLGDASYAIYLGHPFVLTGVKIGARALGYPVQDPLAGALGIVAAVAAAVCFGLLVYAVIERPMLRSLRGLTRRRPEAARLVAG